MKQATEAVDLWMGIAKPIPASEIAGVRWSDEPGYTWRRLPWPQVDGESATWDELLSRMSNAKAFRHFLGSLFFDDSSLHGYVWLHGQGGDGKGAINRFLARVFGHSYRSKQPPSRYGDRFWTYGLLGSRLVVFPDCDDFAFVASGLFKALTGGDPIEVEAKGQMGFTARLNAKFIVISNEKPSLSSENADMRRVIYCEMEKPQQYQKDFEKRLWFEGGAFLTRCVVDYIAAYPDHGPIAADMEQIMEWVAVREEPYDLFFDKHFRVAPHDYVAPIYMQQLLKEEWHDRGQQLGFLRWLERTHGVRKKTAKLMEGLYQNQYRGIARKTSGLKALRGAEPPRDDR